MILLNISSTPTGISNQNSQSLSTKSTVPMNAYKVVPIIDENYIIIYNIMLQEYEEIMKIPFPRTEKPVYDLTLKGDYFEWELRWGFTILIHILNQSTYCAAPDVETEQLLKQDLRSKYVWNHGIISRDGELFLFPFSTEAKDTYKNEQHDIVADEMTSDDEDFNYDSTFF